MIDNLIKEFEEALEIADEVILRETETRADGAHRKAFFKFLTVGELEFLVNVLKEHRKANPIGQNFKSGRDAHDSTGN